MRQFRLRWRGKRTEWLLMTILTGAFIYAGYMFLLQSPPTVTIFSQTQYPKEVVRGGYFFLSFDLSFSKSCNVRIRRIIVGNDGVQYLAQEEEKEVIADKRVQYIVRVPVSDAIPYGNALVRSDVEYGCNLFSRYFVPIGDSGQGRQIKVVPFIEQESSKCGLLPEPGFTIVRAYYRRNKS